MNKDNIAVHPTNINGVWKVERPIFHDDRGLFHEVFRLNELEEITGVKFNPVQWNHSISKPRVIRALHSEGWHKLVYPVTGKIFIAIVDVRPESKTFMEKFEITIDCESKDTKRTALFLPPGIGNSICVAGEEPVNYMYLVSEYWDNSKAKGFVWNDPDMGINWPIKDPILSDRDKKNPRIRDVYPEKFSK